MENTSQKILVSQLQEGKAVESIFLCSHKALLKDKNGKPYINLKLSDRTGEVEARAWEKAPQFSELFNKLDYVWVKANVVAFQGHLQLNIRDIRSVDPETINSEDFLPQSSQDIETMYQELLSLCKQELKNPWISQLILGLLEDPELSPKFKRAPAAKSNHHAWIGGLLEHILQLVKVGRDVLKHYPMVNPDLVLAGLILHDFGKVEELTAERSFEYTDKGQLIGHLIISVELITKQSAKVSNFPDKILQQLQHIILSHHGLLEYGSPKEPMTLEALMVHHLDNMDSKLQGFLDTVAREADGDAAWASPSFMFKRPLYKKTWEDLGENTPNNLKSKTPDELLAKPKAQEKATPVKAINKAKSAQQAQIKKPLKTNLGELLSEQLAASGKKE